MGKSKVNAHFRIFFFSTYSPIFELCNMHSGIAVNGGFGG